MIQFRIHPIVAMLLFCGACSTVSTRIKERPLAFTKLSPAEQALVRAGKIQNGFSPDEVYLAWGKADKITPGSAQGKPSETWIYVGFRQEVIPYYEVIPQAAGRHGFVPDTIYSPIYVSHPYLRQQATFQNGKVVAWTKGQLP
jgi:hypothetical protein